MEFNATFILSLISFILFVCIMNQILYKPISDIVQKRKDYINDNYKTAKDNQDKSETILKERDDKLTDAKNKIRDKSLKEKADANLKKNDLILKAKDETNKKLSENKDVLNNEKKEANVVLKGEIISLAQKISDKLLNEKEIIDEIDTKMIDEIMQG